MGQAFPPARVSSADRNVRATMGWLPSPSLLLPSPIIRLGRMINRPHRQQAPQPPYRALCSAAFRAHMRLRSRRYAPAQREIRSSPRAAHHHESCKHAPAKREILSSCQKIEPSMVVEDEDDYEDARSTPILPITWTFCRSYSMAFSRRSREAV